MKNQSVKGTRDFFGKDLFLKNKIESIFFNECANFNYQLIETPIIEQQELFVRSVGESSDIVQKEMFKILDQEDSLVLRPEGTAGVLRAVLENSLLEKLPIKFAYSGPMFRKEKPQKGRYRQFYQCGVEVFGEPKNGIELELFILIENMLKELKINNYVIQINNIGSKDERSLYKEELYAYFSKNKESLSEDSKKRLSQNVLRILDSKNPSDIEICKNAPLITDFLSDQTKNDFDQILKSLDLFQIKYQVNPFLVRGLDYYSDIVFEIQDLSGKLGSQNALGGGGRYDTLVSEMGKKNVSAIGFAFGLDRLMLCLDNPQTFRKKIISFCTTENSVLPIFLNIKKQIDNDLIQCDINFNTTLSFKKFFQRADKIKADYVVVIGQNELSNKQFKLKNMQKGTEKTLNIDEITNIYNIVINDKD